MGKYIEIDREAGVATVTFSGPVTYQERIDVMDTLCPQMLERDIKRLILDFSTAWQSPHQRGTRDDLMHKIMREPALHGCRVAFLNSVDIQGIPAAPTPNFEIKRFERRDDAFAWLADDGK